MVHIGLRMVRLPKKRIEAQRKQNPRIVFISLINPPRYYRKATQRAKTVYYL